MQRFYLADTDLSQKILTIKNKELIYQLTKVLRAKKGEKIIFFDGKNSFDYLYIIEKIENKEITFTFELKINKIENNFPIINLYQAIPNKLSKIEFILQKGVEVGINSFTFFSSNRSKKLFLSDKKLERLKKIIIESVEQSARNIIPSFTIEDKLSKINIYSSNKNLFFHTNELNSEKLNSINNKENQIINIFVGPEGGWDKDEEIYFEKLGFKKIYLGNNILRTETTGIVVGFYLKQI